MMAIWQIDGCQIHNDNGSNKNWIPQLTNSSNYRRRLNCIVEEMVVCSFTDCKKVAEQAVELICCRFGLLACHTCAAPGFYGELKKCPNCYKSITKKDFFEKAETRRRIEQLRKKFEKWKERAMSTEERLRLKEAITCKVCKEPCSKAVSLLTCCPSASCRKCALGKLREDNKKCWGCQKPSGDVNTPSQLVNNDLVRVGVTFYKEKLLDRSSGTFEIFVLLSNMDTIEVSEIRDRFKNEKLLKRKLAQNAAKERERETKPLSDEEQARLQRLLIRNKTKLQRNGEPIQSQLEVRDTFTGTGSPKLNKELGKGKRHFDGTTVQRYIEPECNGKNTGTWHMAPDSYSRQSCGKRERVDGGGWAVEGLLDQSTREKISKAWIRGEKLASVETKSEFWKYN